MPETITKPRPWLSNDHLHGLAQFDSRNGAIAVMPQRADDIYFDIAWSNSYPANEPDGEGGSRVLDIGRGVEIRASGHVIRKGDGWELSRQYTSAKQYPTGRDLTAAQWERATTVIGEMVGAWAATHAGDIAQADDIYRNNGAHRLEETILRHEQAIGMLREQLRACEEGEPFELYPDLPTDR